MPETDDIVLQAMEMMILSSSGPSVEKLVEHIALVDYHYFSAITVGEWLQGTWENAAKAPHFAAMTKQFNQVPVALLFCYNSR